jgi:hypothetical protein
MGEPRTVAEVLREHVTLELASIDRMYLNIYVPKLQHVLGVVGFFKEQRGAQVVSSVLMEPMTTAFVTSIERFAKQRGVPLITFTKGQRKEEVAASYLAQSGGHEGVLFIGKAQERATVVRTERRYDPQTGTPYPSLVRSTALVNQYYFYAVDDDFGPFFLKFCSYFPYTAKVCLNGHEYLKRQLTKEGLAFEALDNGIRSCADPARLQALADTLDAARIAALVHKWLALLPHPYTPADQQAGYGYEVSILQAEFALTQVLDHPATGRILFEQIIREHLDLGRPEQVQLIFARRVTKQTPSRFRTRVITECVVPSLHIDYKSARLKQYHKEGCALRTELTVNNSKDFAIGKRLSNLPALRAVGFAATRRLLDVQRLSMDCSIGEERFAHLTQPQVVDHQRVAALRFGDPRVQALLSVIVLFAFVPRGFTHRELRDRLAAFLGLDLRTLSPGRVTYDLRRLRLHGLIARTPGTQRYRPTNEGLRVALFCNRVYLRVIRPGLAQVLAPTPPADPALRPAFDSLTAAIDQFLTESQCAA